MVSALRESRPLARGVVSAAVLGGMSPDVDAALMALGWDVYLRWHDAGTHALVGTPIVALLTATFVRTWAPTTSFRSLWFSAWLGALSHVCFDLYSGATIRLFWPLLPIRIETPIVAMADPIVIPVLLLGAFALWLWPRVPRSAGALVMALLALVSAVKLTTRSMALAAYTTAVSGEPAPANRTIEAEWGSWRGWLVFDRLPDGRIRGWHVDGWSGDVRQRFTQPDQRTQPFADTSIATFATARNFVPSHTLAFVTERQTDDGTVVFWSDVRFCWGAGEGVDPQEGAPHQDVRPAITGVRCALWFGGSLDPQGQPHESLVWLGGHLQRRSPQRW